ncbi:MAG: HAMP domain-containing histidine kinase [Candidatus Paracaedibacteraceae bacterium]|jgi:signal transduction histidine kinase|nr:HAMP domain-containing histidine kinase [Candidatus Paracaedibacteraceae bacterium]
MISFIPQTNLLKRQLSKSTQPDGNINIQLLLELVDRAYLENIKERRLAETNLKIMSTELLESNRELRIQTNELKESKDRLVEATNQASKAARVSGMAEVATNVIHNIGNTLNSVNTTASILTERFKTTKFSNFGKLAALLNEHKDNLNEFFINDPKGRLVPQYILELSEHWKTEVPHLANDLYELNKNIDHIKDCIALQQSMAKNAGMLEPTNLSKIIDSIIELQLKEIRSSAIQIETQYATLPSLMLDRIKIYQIFVNLLQNARQSIIINKSENREIKVSIHSDNSSFVTVSITDTGGGISPDNLKKIFSHGFTTKKDGHGFGLHYCANAANEMGGKISVDSPGEGLGATFTLTLPYQQVDTYGDPNAA